jgi:DNA repair protein RadD
MWGDATGVKHSVHIVNEAVNAGIRAAHLDGSTPKHERDDILAKLATGELEFVSNCMVLTEGWDCPEVSCAVLARPTKKLGMYLQKVGRILRIAPGKKNAIILDHSGAVYAHGRPEDPIAWSLSPDHFAHSAVHKARQAKRETGLCECPQCQALRVGGQPCLVCGWAPKKAAEYVRSTDEDLALLERGESKPAQYSKADKRMWYAMLLHIEVNRPYRPNWAKINYREKFGGWPEPYGYVPDPVEPSLEVRSWVRHRMIAYAKRMEKQAREEARA